MENNLIMFITFSTPASSLLFSPRYLTYDDDFFPISVPPDPNIWLQFSAVFEFLRCRVSSAGNRGSLGSSAGDEI